MDPIKLLLSGYWDKNGWKKPSFNQEETLVLNEAGLIRPATTLGHDAAIDWALEVRAGVSVKRVADAFLYSLASRDLRYRSALGSFAHLQHMPKHSHMTAEGFHTDICSVCGFDDNQGKNINFGVLNFERHKWGGVRHNQLIYMAFDLQQFLALPKFPAPTDEDNKILGRILDAAGSAKNYTALKKAIGPIIPSNNSERDQLCQILSYAGILQPDDCPSFTDAYIDWDKRGDGKPRSDMEYPLGWWNGCTYRDAGVKYWFSNP